MHILEDAICLTFLSLQFAQFNAAISDEDKMVSPSNPLSQSRQLVLIVLFFQKVVIVRKTWAKMTEAGHSMVVNELSEGMSDELKSIVGRALA